MSHVCFENGIEIVVQRSLLVIKNKTNLHDLTKKKPKPNLVVLSFVVPGEGLYKQVTTYSAQILSMQTNRKFQFRCAFNCLEAELLFIS